MSAYILTLVLGLGLLTFGQLASAAYYLFPPNLQLSPSITGQLVVVDDDGSTVQGTLSFFGYNTDLVSISGNGVVTPLRLETATEIGTWISASINGIPVSTKAIVRVLSRSYDLSPQTVRGANSILHFPGTIQGETLSGYVAQYQLPTVNDYAYLIQANLMGGRPFVGAKQVFEVDVGETEQQRVCGISGNPIRIGWNILGQPWNNCFLWDPHYIDPRAPRWAIFYHELGHNFTTQSRTFARGLGIPAYVEGLATAIGYATLDAIGKNPSVYPLSQTTRSSIATALGNDYRYGIALENWLAAGAEFSKIDPDVVDGIYLEYRAQRPGDFDRRFFAPLQLQYVGRLSSIVENLAPGEEHTFFAALMSSALGKDLSSEFIDRFHYPLNPELFSRAYLALTQPAIIWLTVTRAGSGAGAVSSNPSNTPDIDCGTACIASFPVDSNVQLIATPTAGSVFGGWSVGCTGREPCIIVMSTDESVTATFTFFSAGSAYSNDWVQRAYVAYYGRPADPAGQAYWAARMDIEGGSLSSIIAAFGTSEEFTRRYGGLTYSQLIDRLYQQTLGRLPDAAGKQWYLDQLNAGRTTPQTITLDLLGGATGTDAETVAHRLDVANHYTGKVAAGCSYAGESMGVSSLVTVTSGAATAWAAKLAIEDRCRP